MKSDQFEVSLYYLIALLNSEYFLFAESSATSSDESFQERDASTEESSLDSSDDELRPIRSNFLYYSTAFLNSKCFLLASSYELYHEPEATDTT